MAVTHRLTRLITTIAVLLVPLAGVGLVAAAPAAARIAATQRSTCPDPGERPPPGSGGPLFTDNGIAVYAGGDYLADGTAAESEGLLVVGGDATIDKSNGGVFNIGTVGVGSGIDPEPGSDMFVVGGNVRVGAGTTASVGASVNGAPGGGDVRVGGDVSGSVDTNGGAVSQHLGAAALGGYATVPGLIERTSTTLAAAAPTGVVTRTGTQLLLAGDGVTDRQAFRIPATQLSGATEVRLSGIPAGASVAVTVTGSDVVTFSPVFFSINGVRVDDFAAPDNGFGRAAGALLWNFPDTTRLTLGGTSQFMGSVLMPAHAGALDVTASTNGRIYVNGDLHVHGVNNEHHNYPWDAPFDCLSGSFAVSKQVTGDAAGDVPAGTSFTVHYRYAGGSGDIHVPGSGLAVDGPALATGTVVTFTEVLPDVPDVSWGDPVITVDGRATDRLTVGAGTARIVVTNVADPSTSPPTEPPTEPPTGPPTQPPTPPATGTPGGSTTPSTPSSSSSAALAGGGAGTAGLAATGVDVAGGIVTAGALVGLGVVIMLAGRTRRRHGR